MSAVTSPPPPRPQHPTRVLAPFVQSSGARSAKRGSRSTPAILRRRALTIVVIAVVAGLAGSFVASDRAGSTDRIDDEVEVIRSSRSIQADLARADAAAASGFLAGGSRAEIQSEQRERYLAAMADVAADLEAVARLTGDDELSHRQIEEMTRLVAEYSGLVETARTNNRQGFPIGAAYLNAASDLLTRDGEIGSLDQAPGLAENPAGVFRLTDEVANAAAQRYRDEYNDQQSISWAFVGLAAGAMVVLSVVLVGTLGFMAARFRRVVNPAVGIATVISVGLSIWMLFGFATHSSALRSAREDGYGGIRSYVDARALAFGAKSDEAKYLIARGDGDRFEARFVNRDLSGVVAEAAGGADSTLERDEGRQASDMWAAYEDLHVKALRAEQSGRRADALQIVLSSSLEGSIDEFEAFDLASANALQANQDQFDSRMSAARDALGGLTVAPAIGALLIALFAWYGIQQRIAEYR